MRLNFEKMRVAHTHPTPTRFHLRIRHYSHEKLVGEWPTWKLALNHQNNFDPQNQLRST